MRAETEERGVAFHAEQKTGFGPGIGSGAALAPGNIWSRAAASVVPHPPPPPPSHGMPPRHPTAPLIRANTHRAGARHHPRECRCSFGTLAQIRADGDDAEDNVFSV